MEGDQHCLGLVSVQCLFQSTPSAWRETFAMLADETYTAFQSTPSAWWETPVVCVVSLGTIISIHSLRMEGDVSIIIDCAVLNIFQSTPSAWRETCQSGLKIICKSISIHSLRMEGDRFRESVFHRYTISIHSLRMEGDLQQLWYNNKCKIFQSTPSAWRETCNQQHSKR